MASIQAQIKKMKKKRSGQHCQPKIFFTFIMHENNYVYVKEANDHVENLLLMTSNRKESNIVLLTSNHFRLVVAKE